MLLIGGGSQDPNLQALLDTAALMGRPCLDLRVPPHESPPFHWVLPSSGRLLSSIQSSTEETGSPFRHKPTGAFLRQDVFAGLQDDRPEVHQRAHGWFVALNGWLLAHEDVRLLNRSMRAVALNKPAALLRARAHGLRVPDTWITNVVERLRERAPDESIAKPVAGGGLCQSLRDALPPAGTQAPACTAMPAIVQGRLRGPEMRLFVVGAHAFAFEVRSPSLDYRALQDAEVVSMPCPTAELQGLRRLMDDLGMDFGAADFKQDTRNGQWVFLELNTSPMFARFNLASEGALCRAMVDTLTPVA